jgi:hypothetical protein
LAVRLQNNVVRLAESLLDLQLNIAVGEVLSTESGMFDDGSFGPCGGVFCASSQRSSSVLLCLLLELPTQSVLRLTL